MLKEQLLVPVNLLLVFFYLQSFFFDFLHFFVVLSSYQSLFLFQGASELRCVLYLLAARQHLRVHGLDLLLQELPLLLLLEELPRPEFQGRDRCVLVFLGLLLLHFDLRYLLVAEAWVVLSAVVQFLLQPPQLDFVFPQKRPLVYVLVDPGLVLDFLGPVCELECRLRLPEGIGRRGDHCHHGGLAVASEGVLQDSGELGVPVGDVGSCLLVGEGGDDVSEGAQRLVDFLTLFQALSSGLSHSDPLTTSKIYKIELANLDLFRAI